jgi:hypothetical protein
MALQTQILILTSGYAAVPPRLQESSVQEREKEPK